MESPAATSPSPRVARKRQQRADEILSAALHLLSQDGIEALTISRLARQLDYVPGALYRYFPSRDALLAELQRQILDHALGILKTSLDELPAGAGGDGLERLRCIGRQFAAYADTFPQRFALLHLALADPRILIEEEDARVALEAALPLLALVRAELDRAVDDGHLWAGDSNRRALLFWGALQGVQQLRKAGRFVPAADPAALTASMVETLLAGWR